MIGRGGCGAGEAIEGGGWNGWWEEECNGMRVCRKGGPGFSCFMFHFLFFLGFFFGGWMGIYKAKGMAFVTRVPLLEYTQGGCLGKY